MAMSNDSSQSSIMDATRSRAKFSGHASGGRTALGAAGYRMESDHPENCDFLSAPGDSVAISPPKEGFEPFRVGVAWDNLHLTEETNFFKKLFKKARKKGVDLDIGCLYELKDGSRGALQAFGDKYGFFNKAPYIRLSGDERTGDAEGDDEFMDINGAHWNEIERVLVYIYIYEGAALWSNINPQIVIDVAGENDLYVTLKAHQDELDLCAVGILENVRGGIKLSNCTEYFTGHEEMDRAFGFGLDWADGSKDS